MKIEHDHTTAAYQQIPNVERMDVYRVQFRRGTGCCEESPIRIVAAYFDADAELIFEVDPVKMP